MGAEVITSRKDYPFGGRVSTVENEFFRCMISTAKEGVLEKQSVEFLDFTLGMDKRVHVGKILYNDELSSAKRLELHDVITGELERLASEGDFTILKMALRMIINEILALGLGDGIIIDEYE